jgi:phosphoglycerate transporter family protein
LVQSLHLEELPSSTLLDKASNAEGRTYSYWRRRIMLSIMVGYAAFYLVRQNFTMAIPYLQSELGYSKAEIGIIISTGAILYGLGKGLSGLLGDRSNARYLMSAGLLGSAIVSFCLGFSSTWTVLLVLYTLNMCFQSMGWPPCAKLLTHWFSPKEIGTKWALWNTSQQIGGATVLIISPYIMAAYGWRYVFYVPAVLCVGFAFFLLNRLRDTPESLGLPAIEAHHGLVEAHEVDDSKLSTKEIFFQVTRNKLVWYMCGANFFVYIVRMFMFNWAPTFLSEFKGSSLKLAGWQAAMFDITAMFGGLIAGYLSDKVFEGRRGRVGFLYMIVLSLSIWLLWKAPIDQKWQHFLGMMLIGFLVTGPQILVGVAAADFASKKAAGAASGLTGTVGYLGAAVTGVGVGVIVDKSGWDAAFAAVTVCALLSAFFFVLTWNHRAKVLDKQN